MTITGKLALATIAGVALSIASCHETNVCMKKIESLEAVRDSLSRKCSELRDSCRTATAKCDSLAREHSAGMDRIELMKLDSAEMAKELNQKYD